MAEHDDPGTGLLRALVWLGGGNLLAVIAAAATLVRGIATVDDVDKREQATRAWVLEKMVVKREADARIEGEIAKVHTALNVWAEASFSHSDWRREKENLDEVHRRQDKALENLSEAIRRLEVSARAR